MFTKYDGLLNYYTIITSKLAKQLNSYYIDVNKENIFYYKKIENKKIPLVVNHDTMLDFCKCFEKMNLN
jgi:hypothetical protein